MLMMFLLLLAASEQPSGSSTLWRQATHTARGLSALVTTVSQSSYTCIKPWVYGSLVAGTLAGYHLLQAEPMNALILRTAGASYMPALYCAAGGLLMQQVPSWLTMMGFWITQAYGQSECLTNPIPPQTAYAGQPYSLLIDTGALFTNPDSGTLWVQAQGIPKNLPGWLSLGNSAGAVSDLLYVGAAGAGVRILNSSNPLNLTVIGNGYSAAQLGGSPAYGVSASSNLLYASAHASGVRVLNISNLLNLTTVSGYSSVQLGGNAYGVAISGNLLYVAADTGGAQILNSSNPMNLSRVGSGYSLVQLGGNAADISVSGSLLYVAASNGGVRVLNSSNPLNLTVIGNGYSVAQFGGGTDYVYGVSVSGNLLYVAAYMGGVRILNISNPLNLTAVGVGYSLAQLGGSPAFGVSVSGNLLYVAAVGGGVHVLNISNPLNLTAVGNGYSQAQLGGSANGIAIGSSSSVASLTATLSGTPPTDTPSGAVMNLEVVNGGCASPFVLTILNAHSTATPTSLAISSEVAASELSGLTSTQKIIIATTSVAAAGVIGGLAWCFRAQLAALKGGMAALMKQSDKKHNAPPPIIIMAQTPQAEVLPEEPAIDTDSILLQSLSESGRHGSSFSNTINTSTRYPASKTSSMLFTANDNSLHRQP